VLTSQVTYFDTVLSPNFSVEEEEKGGSFERLNNMDANSLLLRSTSRSKHALRLNHPTPDMMLALWEYYSCHVDRMAKVLYKPTVQALVHRAAKDITSITTVETPLLFAIW
jgi:hypothetical protein